MLVFMLAQFFHCLEFHLCEKINASKGLVSVMQQPANIQLFMGWPSNISHCTALVKPTPHLKVE